MSEDLQLSEDEARVDAILRSLSGDGPRARDPARPRSGPTSKRPPSKRSPGAARRARDRPRSARRRTAPADRCRRRRARGDRRSRRRSPRRRRQRSGRGRLGGARLQPRHRRLRRTRRSAAMSMSPCSTTAMPRPFASMSPTCPTPATTATWRSGSSGSPTARSRSSRRWASSRTRPIRAPSRCPTTSTGRPTTPSPSTSASNHTTATRPTAVARSSAASSPPESVIRLQGKVPAAVIELASLPAGSVKTELTGRVPTKLEPTNISAAPAASAGASGLPSERCRGAS